jgi:hypothetical protein
MVFVSKNLVRKCKYCEKEPKKNLTSGRNKGWYLTCGNKECLRQQYENQHVCILKGKRNTPINFVCFICNNKFESKSSNHKRYCKECVPDKSWRGRAQRYGVGKKQWDILMDKQEGKCALCSKIPEVVDHCHKEGIVRGLLCNGCNLKIEILAKDESFLYKAMKYVGKDYAIS